MSHVLMLAVWDWANTGWRFRKCLRHLGLEVVALKGHPHQFKYPEEIALYGPLARKRTHQEFPISLDVPELRPIAEKAKIIHMLASTYIYPGIDLKEKCVVVQHSGVNYSLEPQKANKIFNPIADATLMQYPGLLGYRAKNEHLIIYPIDEDFFPEPDFGNSKKLVIGHFPSSPVTKGTDKVIRVIERLENTLTLKDKFEYIGTREINKNHHITWAENLKRMKRCDVIIETIQPTVYLGDRPGQYVFNPTGNGHCDFGDWGNTALEASILGKVVVTNCLHTDIYKSHYKCDLPLYVTNDERMLRLNLIKLILMNKAKLREEKEKHYEWVTKNHSIKPTAERLWDEIYSKFF